MAMGYVEVDRELLVLPIVSRGEIIFAVIDQCILTVTLCLPL